MIGKTNTGGGGFAYGMIVVNYPAGSALTIQRISGTGGNPTKKDIITTGDTYTRIYYPKSAGKYRITATQGTKSTSTEVTISSWGQSVSITMNYQLVLYNYGTIETTISGGLTKYDNNSAPVNFNEDNISMGGTTAAAKCSVATTNQIDVSSYNSLKVTYANTSNYPFTFGLITTNGQTPTYETGASYDDGSKHDDPIEATLDISGFTGEYYVGFNKTSAGTRRIYRIVLE